MKEEREKGKSLFKKLELKNFICEWKIIKQSHLMKTLLLQSIKKFFIYSNENKSSKTYIFKPLIQYKFYDIMRISPHNEISYKLKKFLVLGFQFNHSKIVFATVTDIKIFFLMKTIEKHLNSALI